MYRRTAQKVHGNLVSTDEEMTPLVEVYDAGNMSDYTGEGAGYGHRVGNVEDKVMDLPWSTVGLPPV
ncbi:hypothetical protein LTR08_004116 [Meristemomyces frigidus]|nr:hypothetical protein LTR08_004116 [Meristemomyces frigidus]